MTSFMRLPGQLTQWSGPSSSQDSSESASYDYSGLDDLLKKQEEVGGLRDQKFRSIYDGDIPGAVATGGRIRDLLGAIRKHAPQATERSPQAIGAPLVRVASSSSSSSSRSEAPSWHGQHDEAGLELPAGTPGLFQPRQMVDPPQGLMRRARKPPALRQADVLGGDPQIDPGLV